MTVFNRLLPRHADNGYKGLRSALWLLGLLIALRLIMSVRSIASTASVATGDGIPLARFGPDAAREVLTLFAVSAVGQLTLMLIALVVLVRYRALVPLIYLVLLGEGIARRLIVQSSGAVRAETVPAITFLIYGLLALTALGLILSLVPARCEAANASARLTMEEGR